MKILVFLSHKVKMPRMLLLFEAEDPENFVSRIVDAYQRRKQIELQLQQQFYIGRVKILVMTHVTSCDSHGL